MTYYFETHLLMVQPHWPISTENMTKYDISTRFPTLFYSFLLKKKYYRPRAIYTFTLLPL